MAPVLFGTGAFFPILKFTFMLRSNIAHLFLCTLMLLLAACQPANPSAGTAPLSPPPFELDTLQARTFNYFWELADDQNYQIPDRHPTRTFSSIAATGFGLTAYIVGVEDNLITRSEAAGRVQKTLEVLWHLPQGPDRTAVSGHRGFFYHFLTLDKALRYQEVELSTIDTGLLMAGVLSAMSYFDRDNPTERNIRQLADQLYRRVEWDWALNDDNRLSMGWHPERGFIPHDWRGYNEAMILLVLALGSPTHPIPASCWDTWCSTYQWAGYYGYEHVNFPPLFGHQYSHMYIDFREIQDEYMESKGIDYFENSRRATLANRAYCMDNPHQFIGYSGKCWGLTACDGPANERRFFQGDTIQFRTYSARGAAVQREIDDGTIAPTAAGGSVPFAPDICIPTLKHFWDDHHEELVRPYGFADAFNQSYTWGEGNERGWVDTDYIGIDQGPILIQIENHQTELIWSIMKQNPYLVRGLQRAGFTGGWLAEQKKREEM